MVAGQFILLLQAVNCDGPVWPKQILRLVYSWTDITTQDLITIVTSSSRIPCREYVMWPGEVRLGNLKKMINAKLIP